MRYRLSYSMNETNELVSNLVSNGHAQFFALINPIEKIYEIMSISNGESRKVFSAPYSSLLFAKNDIRDRLIGYGVIFDSDIRRKI